MDSMDSIDSSKMLPASPAASPVSPPLPSGGSPGPDCWSREAFQSTYRLAYNHNHEDLHAERVRSSNAVRLLLKSAGNPGGALHMGNWDEAKRPSTQGTAYGARLLVKDSTYRTDFRHGMPKEVDSHLESFRAVALPGDTWNTEHWLSQLSRGLGAQHVTSPRLPIKSEYQGHFNQE
mmetsp:Transcript_1656/g.3828  ORF Transcript_1656/g.3828 Transcript_1656/m.3828 type:complete len:177 (-) Transcript_1656:350-880(-)